MLYVCSKRLKIQVLGKGIHITKRDMFYTDVKLFREQGDSDTVLDDVACMVGCTRSCLNVVASDKGLVVGRVTFLEDGKFLICPPFPLFFTSFFRFRFCFCFFTCLLFAHSFLPLIFFCGSFLSALVFVF